MTTTLLPLRKRVEPPDIYILQMNRDDDERRLKEKWRLLRYLHSLRKQAARRCGCVENILWKIGSGHPKEYRATIGADAIVINLCPERYWLLESRVHVGKCTRQRVWI